tara:strand:- start:735 stop:1064 length:330 start_codon:yes stop_codon:yes gene_type:complete
MKYITSISVAAMSTVAGHCDWDFSKPFSTSSGKLSVTTNPWSSETVLKPVGNETFTGFFKLKDGIPVSGTGTPNAKCDFSTVDFPSEKDFMTIGWYSSDSGKGAWSNYM